MPNTYNWTIWTLNNVCATANVAFHRIRTGIILTSDTVKMTDTDDYPLLNIDVFVDTFNMFRNK